MIGLFVDGSYVRKSLASQSNSLLDYHSLRPFVESRLKDRIAVAYWFDARHPDVDCDRRNAALLGAGFRAQTHYRVAREYVRDAEGEIARDRHGVPICISRQKGVDVGLALAVERSYRLEGWRKLALAAGDGDFAELIEELVEREGVRVTLLADRESLSVALKPWAERIVPLAELPMIAARRLRSA